MASLYFTKWMCQYLENYLLNLLWWLPFNVLSHYMISICPLCVCNCHLFSFQYYVTNFDGVIQKQKEQENEESIIVLGMTMEVAAVKNYSKHKWIY